MSLDVSKIISLCKRRGFIFQSSEIYGGISSCWDYGPLGALMKKNLKDYWWKKMTEKKDILGLDSAILMHPKTWKASGHIDTFSDPLRDCKKCKKRFKASDSKKCPYCQSTDLSEIRNFNLMFKTFMGALEDKSSEIYLRPETAQGIFVNFENVKTSLRKKLPFGIAQIGKSFRNEITPGNFIFRTREFEQMEMQYFCSPKMADTSFEFWKEERKKDYKTLGFKEEQIRFHTHSTEELAHYSKKAVDIEFLFPFGWNEVEGIHHRGDFDLKNHQELSGKKLEYFDEELKKSYIPYVIETSVGCDRLLFALLCAHYKEEKLEKDSRSVLSLPSFLSPYFLSLLPLSKKDELKELSLKVFDDLKKDFVCDYDENGSIGKRYRRHDEIGTAFCLTIDFDSLEDGKLTIRDRDSMKQDRISLSEIKNYLTDKKNDI